MADIDIASFIDLLNQKLLRSDLAGVDPVLADLFRSEDFTIKANDEFVFSGSRLELSSNFVKKPDVLCALSALQDAGMFFKFAEGTESMRIQYAMLVRSEEESTRFWKRHILGIPFETLWLNISNRLVNVPITQEQKNIWLLCIVTEYFRREFREREGAPVEVVLETTRRSATYFGRERFSDVLTAYSRILPNTKFTMLCDPFIFTFGNDGILVETDYGSETILTNLLERFAAHGLRFVFADEATISLSFDRVSREEKNRLISIFLEILPCEKASLSAKETLLFNVFPLNPETETWDQKRAFLHGVHSSTERAAAARREAVAKREPSSELMALLHDPRLLRTKGQLVSSFMAGATNAFLPERFSYEPPVEHGEQGGRGKRRHRRSKSKSVHKPKKTPKRRRNTKSASKRRRSRKSSSGLVLYR
jgi:hypothetical protein